MASRGITVGCVSGKNLPRRTSWLKKRTINLFDLGELDPSGAHIKDQMMRTPDEDM